MEKRSSELRELVVAERPTSAPDGPGAEAEAPATAEAPAAVAPAAEETPAPPTKTTGDADAPAPPDAPPIPEGNAEAEAEAEAPAPETPAVPEAPASPEAPAAEAPPAAPEEAPPPPASAEEEVPPAAQREAPLATDEAADLGTPADDPADLAPTGAAADPGSDLAPTGDLPLPPTSTFDLATTVIPGDDGFAVTIDPGWTIGSRPNGGYLLAIATRAALQVTGHSHPLAVSGHFVAAPSAGPAQLAVSLLRSGRSVSTARASLVQDGQPRLEVLVTAGRLEDAEPDWRATRRPPRLAALDRCVQGRSELPNGMRVSLLDQVDVRLDPAVAGWVEGQPSGKLETRGWVRFHDGRDPDPLSLLVAVDALPPASFGLGITTWAPTIELTAYVRELPAPGWLRCIVRGRLLQGGWFDEEAEVWDERGRLVAQARQLAGVRSGLVLPGLGPA